jgi:hypothetical protein
MDIIKMRITPENIDQFYIIDHRLNDKEFIDDRIVLENKIIAHEKKIPNELTAKYPGRYDLTVLTYTQGEKPYLINDGCHRIEALRRLFKKNWLGRRKIKGFDVWLIPSNIIGATTKKDALALNAFLKKQLDAVGLPRWVQKFDYELVGKKLFAWKNINLIDTGGEDTRRQYGVNWFLNEDPRRKLVDVDEHNYKNKYKL